jgi:ribulose-phosphate 3-epimerase
MATPMNQAVIVASVLGADYARLGEELEDLTAAGVDRVQWDIMDGHFVPNLTFGADLVAACRTRTALPFEAHLMVEEPDHWLESYAEAGCDTVIVHVEACRHLHRTLDRLRSLGVKAGAALNPATSLETVHNVLDKIDLLLVMTVNPGFGGQAYIATMETKVAEARGLIDASGEAVSIEVDGGISSATAGGARAAGAELFVAGSAILAHPEGKRAAVAELRRALDVPSRRGGLQPGERRSG